MNLVQLKSALGIESLRLKEQINQSGELTGWWACWENTRRRKLVIHDDVISDLPTTTRLQFRVEDKVAANTGQAYELVIIFQTKEEEVPTKELVF